MSSQIRYFLGSNSPAGFFSLYDDFADSLSDGTLCVLKGGPGCGKSTCMRRIAERLEDAGVRSERIYCSGDPDSLDAVYFPDLRLAYADGTAPHVLEPRYPGAAGRYLDLSAFYDAGALSPLRHEIAALNAAYKERYRRAYALTEAADDAVRSLYEPLQTERVVSRVRARARGFAARELRAAAPGRAEKRFLGALTCRGRLTFFDTVRALADRVCVLDGEYGLAAVFLDEIFSGLQRKGAACVVCPDDQRPARLGHILIPSLSLALVTQTKRAPYTGERFRHIRLDAAAGPVEAEQKRAFRACTRLSDDLEREAISVLAEAKALHDDLERVYNPHVDFAGVLALADRQADAALEKRASVL